MKIKSIERLRAAIEAEREAANAYADGPIEEKRAELAYARIATDDALAKVERQLQNAAEQSKGGPRPTPSVGGRLSGGGGMAPTIQITPGLVQNVIQPPLAAATERDFDREAWRRGYHR